MYKISSPGQPAPADAGPDRKHAQPGQQQHPRTDFVRIADVKVEARRCALAFAFRAPGREAGEGRSIQARDSATRHHAAARLSVRPPAQRPSRRKRGAPARKTPQRAKGSPGQRSPAARPLVQPNRERNVDADEPKAE